MSTTENVVPTTEIVDAPEDGYITPPTEAQKVANASNLPKDVAMKAIFLNLECPGAPKKNKTLPAGETTEE